MSGLDGDGGCSGSIGSLAVLRWRSDSGRTGLEFLREDTLWFGPFSQSSVLVPSLDVPQPLHLPQQAVTHRVGMSARALPAHVTVRDVSLTRVALPVRVTTGPPSKILRRLGTLAATLTKVGNRSFLLES